MTRCVSRYSTNAVSLVEERKPSPSMRACRPGLLSSSSSCEPAVAFPFPLPTFTNTRVSSFAGTSSSSDVSMISIVSIWEDDPASDEAL